MLKNVNELEKFSYAAIVASEEFARIHSKNGLPDEIPVVNLSDNNLNNGKINIVFLLALIGLAVSKSEARRLIVQGGVKVDQKKITDINAEISILNGITVVQIGNRKFVQIKIVY